MDSFSMLHIFGLPPYITFHLLRSEGVKKIKLYWVYKKDGFGLVLSHHTILRWRSGTRWKPWISLFSFEVDHHTIQRCLFVHAINQLSYAMFLHIEVCLFTARKRWKQTMHASHIQGDLHCFPSILPCQRLRCWYCWYVHNPQYSQPYYNIYVQASILQTLCLQVQQACYYDYGIKQTNKDTGVTDRKWTMWWLSV